MGIAGLLEELIQISKKPKTDFALHMNMSPSGLSKILAGARLPLMKERRLFAKQVADYFTETIYSHECYIKLKETFPVIYNFESRSDFHAFIDDAVTYALDTSYAEETGLNLSFTDRGIYYMGSRSVMNQICIALSSCIRASTGEPLEIFASLPLSSGVFSKIFKNIIWFGIDGAARPVLNYYFEPVSSNDFGGLDASKLLESISRFQKYFDLNLYRTSGTPDHFLFIKGKVLLLFYTQYGASPILIPTYNKGHINIFYNSIVSGDNEKISYSTNEIIDLLEKDHQLANNFINRGIDGVYNFTSIGYLLKNQELESFQCSPAVREALLTFFSAILTEQSILFYVSEKAMRNFSLHGNLIAPLIGTVSIPPEQRTAYMHRFSEYLSGDYYDKLKIVSSELFGVAVLCSQNLCIIYTIDDASGQEKIHTLKTSQLAQQMQDKAPKGNRTFTDFSADLWDIYMDMLASSIG